MSKEHKKLVRHAFNAAVFRRDSGECVVCRQKGIRRPAVDAHHITDRHDIPNGGYVEENGISVCASCHVDVEAYHVTGMALPGLHPEDLYRMIGSSLERAWEASEALGEE